MAPVQEVWIPWRATLASAPADHLEHGGLRRLEASFLHPAPEGDVILGGQVFFHAELTGVLALCEGRGKQEEQDSYESEKSFHGL